MASDKAWNKIFRDYDIANHDFDSGPFELTADQIKNPVKDSQLQEIKSLVFCANKIRDLIDLLYLSEKVYSYCPRKMVHIIS